MFEQVVQPFIIESINEWLSAFAQPQKRVFWGYLLSALIIALLWLVVYKKQSIGISLKQIFDPVNWISRSARADYLVMFFNSFIMVLLSPRLLGKTVVAYVIFEWLHALFDGRSLFQDTPPAWLIALSFTLFLFIVDDFARYWLHRGLHTIPVLWSFHKVHHSATSLNPLTVFRSHPVEAILFSIRGALVQGFCVAIFIFFFGDKVTLLSVMGAGLFNFVFNLLGSNLRHSPVSIGYWKPVERLLISPAQHQIHHSYAAEHIDKNYGMALACWDYFFNTLCYSTADQKLNYGLNAHSGDEQHGLKTLYLQPFIEAAQTLLYKPVKFAKASTVFPAK